MSFKEFQRNNKLNLANIYFFIYFVASKKVNKDSFCLQKSCSLNVQDDI